MSDSLGKIAAVAWRDFKHTVLTKAFIFGAIGVPIIMLGLIALLIPLMSPKPRPLTGTVAIVAPHGGLIEAAQIEFSDGTDPQIEAISEATQDIPQANDTIDAAIAAITSELEVTLEPHDDPDDVTELKDRVRSGQLIAVAVFDDSVVQIPDLERDTEPSFILFVGADVEPRYTRALEQRLGEAVVRARVEGAGHDVERVMAMLDAPSSRTARLLDDGTEASEGAAVRVAQELIPVVFMMLLWGATFASAQHLMMSTIEEKSNKVVEVLLSAVSPLQLMAGKILGQGLVGLIVLGMYSALGIVAMASLALMHLVPIMYLVYLAIFFVMAYFMIASIMAGIGSAVTEIREANSLITPAMMLLFIPLFLWPAIKDDPNGAVATVFSFIPPAIPFVMILRVTASEPVPLWQIPLTIVWGYVCVMAMIWMASKIFRVGVLMYGKPPSPLELLKWIRYS
jgi:ABC-type Na+ efflux pump permease subunit